MSSTWYSFKGSETESVWKVMIETHTLFPHVKKVTFLQISILLFQAAAQILILHDFQHLPYVANSQSKHLLQNDSFKVFERREVREVLEGADCYCDKKLSKYC